MIVVTSTVFIILFLRTWNIYSFKNVSTFLGSKEGLTVNRGCRSVSFLDTAKTDAFPQRSAPQNRKKAKRWSRYTSFGALILKEWCHDVVSDSRDCGLSITRKVSTQDRRQGSRPSMPLGGATFGGTLATPNIAAGRGREGSRKVEAGSIAHGVHDHAPRERQ